ncbi:hypothetical protein CR513_15622, partial [Mucuna pruriens]
MNSTWKPMRTLGSISIRSSNFMINKSRGRSFKSAREYSCLIRKLRSRWDGPFVITNVFPYGVVELKDEHTNNTFQVNGHQIKLFHEGPTPIVGDMETISLMEPVLPNDTPSASLRSPSIFMSCIENNCHFPLFQIKLVQVESIPTPIPSQPNLNRLRFGQLITSQSRKTMINLNLRGTGELWNCFGSGSHSSVGETPKDIARVVHPKRVEKEKKKKQLQDETKKRKVAKNQIDLSQSRESRSKRAVSARSTPPKANRLCSPIAQVERPNQAT